MHPGAVAPQPRCPAGCWEKGNPLPLAEKMDDNRTVTAAVNHPGQNTTGSPRGKDLDKGNPLVSHEKWTTIGEAKVEETVGGWRSLPAIVGGSVSANWWVIK